MIEMKINKKNIYILPNDINENKLLKNILQNNRNKKNIKYHKKNINENKWLKYLLPNDEWK